MRLGLSVKSVRITDPPPERFFLVYAGSDATVQDGSPLVAHYRPLDSIEPGELVEEDVYEGEGMLLLPPVETRGGIVAIRVELWGVMLQPVGIEERLETLRSKIDFANPVTKALTGNSPGVVLGAFEWLAGGINHGGGERLGWSGAFFADQLPSLAGASIVRETSLARVEYRLLVTEAP